MQNKYIVVEEQKGFSVRVLKISDIPGLKIMVFSRNLFSKKMCCLLQFHDTKIDPKTNAL